MYPGNRAETKKEAFKYKTASKLVTRVTSALERERKKKLCGYQSLAYGLRLDDDRKSASGWSPEEGIPITLTCCSEKETNENMLVK